MIGSTEWILILAVVLLLFGGSAIPRIARSLGKARAEFEKGAREGNTQDPAGPEQADTKASRR
ncbi:MAG TPA: twin-arginine translocase TatA/TatE family subunit [Spirochaetia bacterium]|nr:twin-arginine translocase TatA/TatE family subunit [Spirochaetia bacterium]